MALKLITPPLPIVTIAEIKKHVRAEYFTHDDDYLESCVAAATDHIDGANGWVGRAFGTQTWDYVIDAFPCVEGGGIRLPLPPMQSVTYVKYISPDTGLEVDATGYTVDAYSDPGWVMPSTNGWPSPMTAINAVRVRFVAGYLITPPSVKQAIKLLAGHYYENRESVVLDSRPSELPQAVESILDKFRNFSH
jgi:uncharacterized phiE125 gp8 family phage protein